MFVNDDNPQNNRCQFGLEHTHTRTVGSSRQNRITMVFRLYFCLRCVQTQTQKREQNRMRDGESRLKERKERDVTLRNRTQVTQKHKNEIAE